MYVSYLGGYQSYWCVPLSLILSNVWCVSGLEANEVELWVYPMLCLLDFMLHSPLPRLRTACLSPAFCTVKYVAMCIHVCW